VEGLTGEREEEGVGEVRKLCAGEKSLSQFIVNVSAAPPDPTGQNTALGRVG